MGEVDLILSILSIPAGHLYGMGADWIAEKLKRSEQDALNKAIKDALKRFFEDADISKTYQWVNKKWYQDIKSAKIPLNKIVTRDGLLQSLESYYPEYQDKKEKMEDAVNKMLPYIVSRLIDDPRAAAFIAALKETAQKKKEADEQAKRDAQAFDTNRTVHEIRDLLPANDTVSLPPSAPARTPADNQEYLEHFYAPLFLEERESKVTLASVYVSPCIETKDQPIRAAEHIMQWYKKAETDSCMLLFGNAGVGKSSLVSKIIADAHAEDAAERAFDLRADQVLAVALRDHCNQISMDKKADEILTDLFAGYELHELKNRLLILDGLDEVCVLKRDFDGYKFLIKMSNLKTGFHVLVTSRDAKDYFKNPRDIKRLQTAHLQWDVTEVEAWCRKYCTADESKTDWCKQFILDFNKLPQDDHRREIFCVPIILYICGNRGIRLTDHDSVGSIYDDAFRNILRRKHLDGQGDYTILTDADEQSNRIAWQYTKELAYQMFLHNTLDLAESDDQENPHTKWLQNAKKRTKDILKEKKLVTVVDDNALDIKKELALCPFTKANGETGITFAHKSVCEYFTAVKLYEDYFVKFNQSYFSSSSKDKDAAAADLMKTAFAAFRYYPITKDVMQYLCGMRDAPFSESDGEGFYAEKFMEAFVHAMETRMLETMEVQSPVCEYFISHGGFDPVNTHIVRAFRALLCFLTGIGFWNKTDAESCKDIRDMLVCSDQAVNLSKWNLQEAYLKEANLQKADLRGADLRGADLHEANLQEAKLQEANLQRADLYMANLKWADLQRANLQGADLQEANLRHANLQEANLQKAYLQWANLQEADLRRADLQGANLQEADLQKAKLQSAKMQGADLQMAKLKRAMLKRAALHQAKLQMANLREANLRFAALQGANLQGADLRGAILQGADLQGADLQEANLKYAEYCRDSQAATVFPFDFNPEEHGMIETDITGDPVD